MGRNPGSEGSVVVSLELYGMHEICSLYINKNFKTERFIYLIGRVTEKGEIKKEIFLRLVHSPNGHMCPELDWSEARSFFCVSLVDAEATSTAFHV